MTTLQTGVHRFWIHILVIALALRLVLAWFVDGHSGDLTTFRHWADVLLQQPLHDFYAVAAPADHLPGDLYIHWALAKTFRLFGGVDPESDGYRFLLRLVPSVADILIASMTWLILRRSVSEGVAREAAVLTALNPALIYVSAVWGQWDAVSMSLMLAGIAIVWLRPRRWLLAVPIFAWVALIKPPLAVPCLLAIMTLLVDDCQPGTRLSELLKRRSLAFVTAGGIGLLTTTVLILPFDVGWPSMDTRWSLFNRLQVALDTYQHTTMGAANIWIFPISSPVWVTDQQTVAGGLTAQMFGNVLLLSVLLGILFVAFRKRHQLDPHILMTWAMATAAYALFLLPTRAHERYLFPAVVLIVLLAGLLGFEKRLLLLSAAVSLTYVVNLAAIFPTLQALPPATVFVSLANANVILFVILATFPFWWRTPGGWRLGRLPVSQ